MEVIFYAFSTTLILSAFLVTISNHSVLSLLFLVSCFLSSSCLLFLLECEFLALLFIIVYVGAISILFLFAVMMLEYKKVNLVKYSMKFFPVSLIFIIGLLFPLFKVIDDTFENISGFCSKLYLNNFTNWFNLTDATNDINVYGQILYSYFVLHFLVAGLILLLVLIGIVYLTSSFKKNTRQQTQFRQLSRKASI